MLKNFLIITLLTFGFSAQSQAVDTINVVGKAHYKGQDLVRLKRLANQKLKAMGENPNDFELVGVSLEAKSRKGKGRATLIVGQDKDTKVIEKFGDGLFWDVSASWAYHTYHWDLSGLEGKANERWQMAFRGNIKVKSIQVHVASARKRVRIAMGGELMTQQSTIFLRRELKRMGYETQGKKLRRVVLVAKSRAGRGKSRLQIGNSFSHNLDIPTAANGFSFQSERPASYNRMVWRVGGNTPGVWQVDLRGRIKVKAVIVEFK